MSSVRSQEVLVGNTIFVSLSEVWATADSVDNVVAAGTMSHLMSHLATINH